MVRFTFQNICTLAFCAALAGCVDDSSAPSGNIGGAGGNSAAGAAGHSSAGTGGANAGSGGSSAGAPSAGAGGASAGSAGADVGGSAGAGGDTSGTAGAGGSTAGAGGAPGAGAGGALGGAGAGGAPPVELACNGTGWTASALISGPGTVDPPADAIDRGNNMNNTRFSTGRPMAVGDWIQVDLGQTLPLDSLSIRWAASDYAATFDVRLSDTPLNHAATANVVGAVGMMGTQTVNIPGGASGRYLLVTLTSTGGSTKWWSIQNIAVACTPPGGGGGGAGGMGGTGGTAGGGGGAPGAGAGGAPTAGAGGVGGTAGAETGGGAGGGTAGAETGGGGAGGGTSPGGCLVAAECDDSNPCTDDVCTSGVCSNPANNATCADDGNACTSNVCSGGVCTHPTNDLATCSDGDECTNDACVSGTCTGTPSGSCVCNADADCVNTNTCLDVACVAHQCVTTPNTSPCADDGNPCTDDVCSQGSCGKDKGTCVGENLFMIRVHRPQTYQYVYVSTTDSVLNSNGVAPGATAVAGHPYANVFEKVYLDGTKLKFKIKDVATGLFVTLVAPDRLYATADLAGATIFGAPACADPFVGLYAYSDDDNNRVVTAGANQFLEASVGACNAGDAGSWEKLELLPVAAGCKVDADCNDNNVCTTETCVAGKCTFANEPSTTACATDNVDCTSDVCVSGTCSHVDDGACGTPLITIKTNNGGKFVVLGTDNFLEWTGTVITDGAIFEMVDHVGTTFKLRAQNGLFVTLNDINGTSDELVANASYVSAVTFDSSPCATKQSLQALDDVDNNRFVQAPTANPAVTRLRAANATCGTTNTSWEQFEFPAAPVAPVTP